MQLDLVYVKITYHCSYNCILFSLALIKSFSQPLLQNHFSIVLGASHDFKYGLMPGTSSDFKYGLLPSTSNDFKFGLLPGASNDFKYGLLPESWPTQETWENGKYWSTKQLQNSKIP